MTGVITGDIDGGTAVIDVKVLYLSTVHIEHCLTAHIGAAQLDDALVEYGVTYAAADLAAVQVQGRRLVAAWGYFNGSVCGFGGRNYPAALAVADVQRGIALHLNHGGTAAKRLSVQAEVDSTSDGDALAYRDICAQIVAPAACQRQPAI